ncbi:TetR/AcrR family transcriptional regulator [Dyella sp. ASV21]|jgi:AcrR family transcriptional regulator|uniref:TetR/AcrR family transcriptional regulator n=1 Tax=Dyella sp. ASV21 TaxID=2795114 RepID=UPI0018ED4209|nr:TetR/AcrR family transcriptional regulator [Dyella sp. ASV21]
MASESQPKPVPKRRAPAQARARQTRELILEAAIQLLEKRGLRAFSTNRLAAAAGFSVGTLYQYFENKQEILDALARHERDRRLARMTEALTSRGAEKLSLRDRIRIVVRTELHAFDGRQRARKIMFDLAWRNHTHRDMDRPVTTLAAMLAAGEVADGSQGVVRLSPTDAFVLTQAVAGIVRAGLERDEHMLVTPEFEDAVVELVAGFVDARRQPPRPA